MRIVGARIFTSFSAGKLKMLTRVTPTVNLASQDNCCKTFNKKEKLILYKTSLRANYFLQIVVNNFKFAFGWDFWQTVQFILILVREKKNTSKTLWFLNTKISYKNLHLKEIEDFQSSRYENSVNHMTETHVTFE